MPSQAHAKDTLRRARQEAYRGLILEAAVRVFGAKPYGEAKVAEIALGAGIATGTVYACFPSKRDLYRAVHRENLDALAAAYAEIPPGGSVQETILARSGVSTRFLTSRPDYLRMYLREAGGWGFDAEGIPEAAAAFMEDALYERGVAEGELIEEDPGVLQSLMRASHQVHLSHWLQSGMREAPADLAGRIQAYAKRAFFRAS
ncbi:MAG: helix-turn-helix domain-containing protein [Myxococcota bacterium]